jgi:hypothetical protein
MSISHSIHPLGYGDTDQIDPVVAEALTPYQVEWLFRQCQDLRLKKLQILRQALFEWIDEHPDYRFSASTFGYVMRVALENYMNRHEAEFVPVRPRTM